MTLRLRRWWRVPEARIWERSTGELMVGSRVGSCVFVMHAVFPCSSITLNKW